MLSISWLSHQNPPQTFQIYEGRRQGVRVQPQFPSHPAHQAGQPSLPAGAAGAVHPDKFYSDQRRIGGPAAGGSGQHGETWPGAAEGKKRQRNNIWNCWATRMFFINVKRDVNVNLSRPERRTWPTHRLSSEDKQWFALCCLSFTPNISSEQV